MRLAWWIVVGAMTWAGGCSAQSRQLPSLAYDAPATGPERALAELSSDGPERFAMVTPSLYRGGQPDDDDLERLRALGVTTIIDLRRERLGLRRAESATARRLGMRFLEYPYYGVFGADSWFIRSVVDQMRASDGGAVYVHCSDGGDRTSLMVALYRVLDQGWDPADAWRREALAYDHHPGPLYREIELTYREAVHEHQLAARTADEAVTSLRIIAAAQTATPPVDGESVHMAEAEPRETLDQPPVARAADQELRASDDPRASAPLVAHSTP